MTIAIVLGLTMTTFAQGGLFHRGASAPDGERAEYGLMRVDNAGSGEATPMLPNHNADGNQPAPVGSGIAVLVALGGAYLVGKKQSHENKH